MRVFFSLLKYLINSTARNIYWLYNSVRIKSGTSSRFSFPFIVEGKGKITFGDNVRTEKMVKLGCAAGSRMSFGNGTKLNRGISIITSDGVTLTVGNGFSLREYSQCYAHDNWTLGDNVSIAGYCQLFAREPGYKGKLLIGDGSNIGDYSIIDISAGVDIGKVVAIGPRCTIYTHDHHYTEKDIMAPWKGKPLARPVIIEDGAWIGANVTILPGVSIGRNAIIAAGSVVTKNVPPNTLYAGIPARLVKNLDAQ